MNDEQFEKILNEYVKSERRDPNKDLEKYYRQIEINGDSTASKKVRNSKYLLSVSICFILVIFVALAIILPLVLPKGIEPQELFFFDEADISFEQIESVREFNLSYNTHIKNFNIECLNSIFFTVSEKNNLNNLIGLKGTYSIYSEKFINSNFYAFVKNNRVNFGPKEYPNTIEYDNKKVKYKSIIKNSNIVDYFFEFTENGIVYVMQVSCYQDIGIEAVLDEVL